MDDLLKTESGIYLPPSYNYYIKPTERDISQRKLEGLQKLAEIKQWGLKNPTRFLKEFIGVELLDNQQYVFMNSWSKPFCLWLESRAAGKAVDIDTRIPTPDGDKTMKDINVGDMVFDEEGRPTKVVYTSPIYYDHDCYKVTFEDGEEIIADGEHNWYVSSWSKNKYNVKTTSEMKDDFVSVRSQIGRKDGKYSKPTMNCYKYRVPINQSLQYEEKELPVPPYILGLFLGDGTQDNGNITCHKNDYPELSKYIKETGTMIYSQKEYRKNIYRLVLRLNEKLPLKVVLREMGLTEEKFIPEIYLTSSVEQRKELLRGLMDSDGTANKSNGICEIAQSLEKHARLFKDIETLVSSLGYKNRAYYSDKKCQTGTFKAGRLFFYVSKQDTCFKLTRKTERLKDILPKKVLRKSIISIEKVSSVPVKCIQVDSPSHLYLCGEKNTITHNTTMLALYAMTKGLLLNNYRIYICSGTADQSQETFRKIEDIALKNIESMTGLTDVFKYEVEVNQANSNGFIHNPMGFTYSLYNGSFVKTLNSNINAKRGLSIRQRIAGFFIIQKWIMFHAKSLAS